MAEHMRPIAGARHVRPVERPGGNLRDGFRAEGTDGGRNGQKHVRGRYVGAGAFPIDEESIAYFLWQGKACGALRLAFHAERGIVPVNIGSCPSSLRLNT